MYCVRQSWCYEDQIVVKVLLMLMMMLMMMSVVVGIMVMPYDEVTDVESDRIAYNDHHIQH